MKKNKISMVIFILDFVLAFITKLVVVLISSTLFALIAKYGIIYVDNHQTLIDYSQNEIRNISTTAAMTTFIGFFILYYIVSPPWQK